MRICKLIFMLVFIVSTSVTSPVLAQYDVQYYAVSSSGGEQTGGSMHCYTTVGQPAIEISTHASKQAKLGFWNVLEGLYIGTTSAVTFAAVGANLSDESVVLHWEISEADGLEGFNIYRSPQQGEDFVRLNNSLLPPDQNTFTDQKVKPGETYWYVVGAVDRDGESISVAVKIEIPIKKITLFQNYPNPFNPTTTITFYIPTVEHVNITIYDIHGRKVRQLVNQIHSYGKHRTEWNGRNEQNQLVGSGIYLYKMKAGKKTLIKKMVFLK